VPVVSTNVPRLRVSRGSSGGSTVERMPTLRSVNETVVVASRRSVTVFVPPLSSE
jgi:hypothetical protein